MTENVTSDGGIEQIDGVRYVTESGSKLRVVFERHADTESVERVEKITGCSGKLGAALEQYPYAEYPKRSIEPDA